jgi:beta-glucanase (GH16 family)
MHWKDLDGRHAHKGSHYSLREGIFADDFHLFSVEWDPEKINWFVDENQIHSMDITSGEFDAFHKAFFLLLNVAVGGHWPGYPDSTTTFPQQMEVDYVRVFQKKSTAL